MLRACIKHSLGQFNILPLLDFERDSSLDTNYATQSQTPKIPQIEVDANFNPFAQSAAYRAKEEKGAWSSLYVGLNAEEPWHSLEVESQEVTGTLFEQQDQEIDQLTTQIQNKFIVTTIKRGLIVVHQNLAHQRIIYERLLRSTTLNLPASQKKLFSMEIELSAAQSVYVKDIQDALKSLGFEFVIQNQVMKLSAVPSGLSDAEAERIILEVLDQTNK